MKRLFMIYFLFLVLLAGCGETDANSKEMDYEKTKKMVVDILQTEEGKKTLIDLMQDEKMKHELVIQSDVVKSAINEALISEDGKKMWQSLFEDPNFVKGYTEAIQEQHETLMKDLMKDAEYQKQLLEVLQNPEMSELILSLMKSQQFRAHLEETIIQTFETPLFKAKIQEILLKAAQEQQGQEEGGSSGSDPANNSEGSGGQQGEGSGSSSGGSEGG